MFHFVSRSAITENSLTVMRLQQHPHKAFDFRGFPFSVTSEILGTDKSTGWKVGNNSICNCTRE